MRPATLPAIARKVKALLRTLPVSITMRRTHKTFIIRVMPEEEDDPTCTITITKPDQWNASP